MGNDKYQSDLNKRFVALVEALGYSGYSFSAFAQITQSTFSNIRLGRTKPKVEVIEKLVREHSNVNLDWLFTGKGSMLMGKGREVDSNTDLRKQVNKLEKLVKKSMVNQMERNVTVDEFINEIDARVVKLERTKKRRSAAKKG